MTATIHVNGLEHLQDLYDGVAEDFTDIEYQPFMESELDPLADWERGLFDRSQSPDGSPWAPNKPSTIAAKGHSQILRGVRSGVRKSQRGSPGSKTARRFLQFRLSNSLTLKSHNSTGDAIREAVELSDGAALTFGTAVEYSNFHDTGTSRFPARQHVGINEGYLDKMTEREADFTLKQLAKG